MSKKERIRREQEMLGFLESVSEEIAEANDFTQSASPFEISLRLSEMGVRTTGINEIRAILDSFSLPEDSDPDEKFAWDELAEKWDEELASRGRHPSFADTLLLHEVAKYYWQRTRSPISTQVPG